jgi:hypothetical protein
LLKVSARTAAVVVVAFAVIAVLVTVILSVLVIVDSGFVAVSDVVVNVIVVCRRMHTVLTHVGPS